MTDSDVEHVYAAEFTVREAFDAADKTGDRELMLHTTPLQLPRELRFADAYAAADYVRRVTDAELLPRVDVFVKHGIATAHYFVGAIHLPFKLGDGAWAYRELVLLHELAHHAVSTEYGTGMRQGHGPEFRHAMHKLVRRWMGPEAAILLRAAYANEGVQLC